MHLLRYMRVLQERKLCVVSKGAAMKIFKDENGDEWEAMPYNTEVDFKVIELLRIKRKEPEKSELEKEAAHIKCEYERMGYVRGFERAIEVAYELTNIINPTSHFSFAISSILHKLDRYAGIKLKNKSSSDDK